MAEEVVQKVRESKAEERARVFRNRGMNSREREGGMKWTRGER